MIEHPDLFNVRKMMMILAGAPILLLLLISAIDTSWHHVRVWQSAEALCRPTQASMGPVHPASCQK